MVPGHLFSVSETSPTTVNTAITSSVGKEMLFSELRTSMVALVPFAVNRRLKILPLPTSVPSRRRVVEDVDRCKWTSSYSICLKVA